VICPSHVFCEVKLSVPDTGSLFLAFCPAAGFEPIAGVGVEDGDPRFRAVAFAVLVVVPGRLSVCGVGAVYVAV